MTENQFRDSLRAVMADVRQPPPMVLATTLEAGRRARTRRRVALTASTLAVTALVVGAGVAGTHWLPQQGATAAGPPSVAPAARTSSTPSLAGSAPSELNLSSSPRGDATARSGPQYDRGVQLLESLLSMAPTGYTVPPDNGKGTDSQPPNRYHQAANDGDGLWRYDAVIGLARGDGIGGLRVEVKPEDKGLPTDPCAFTQRFWGPVAGQCQTVTVGTAQVGVVTPAVTNDQPTRLTQPDMLAAYLYPDGTSVYVSQAEHLNAAYRHGPKPLTALPFTVDQLAALAVDERLHLR